MYQKYHTSEFNEAFAYYGPLGVDYKHHRSIFRLWAPTAHRVTLHLIEPLNSLLQVKPHPEHPGLWEIEVQGDLYLHHYSYILSFMDGQVHECIDPYARALTANGRAGVILDPENINPPGWSTQRLEQPLKASEIAIYEIHIRDLSIAANNGIKHKGKFLGLSESSCRTTEGQIAGLDYLASLGISHVQIMPVADFATIDEEGNLDFNQQYNWGYDPQNYNVPEGSYSTNPRDPLSRILEFKTLVKALHERGLRVILDVVYNHVYSLESHPLHLSFPGYYFRYDGLDRPLNGSLVGNETASEQFMFRRYMLDSLLYWAKTYNIDGFRFDLMGIHDCQTMQLLQEKLSALDPQILLLGEGWIMGNHPTGVVPSNKEHAAELPGLAFFNDEYRDVLRGSNFEIRDKGLLSGAYSYEAMLELYFNIIARPYQTRYQSPLQNVLYSECHDNATLYDKLKATLPESSEVELRQRQALALSVNAFSLGLNFIHAGQELMRSKKGYENSYRAADEVNFFDYDQQENQADLLAYFKKLLAWRKKFTLFSLSSYRDTDELLALWQITEKYLSYLWEDGGQHYLLAHNFSDKIEELKLPQGAWEILLNEEDLGLSSTNSRIQTYRLRITLAPLQSCLLRRIYTPKA